ncbi:MAG: hypothetical protein M3Z84_06725 [Actinomycetota bacterium]|nr:hypothetical protein [Actinomycetota bacterium]
MQYAGMSTLDVLDQGEPIAISFDDLLKYHGRSSIGGVAHGFKVMERALPLLAGGHPPERHDIAIATAFPGPGARDAFEMVTRAVTADRYEVDEELAGPEVPEAPEGRYFFRLDYLGTVVDLTLRPGLIRDDFIPLVRKEHKTPADEERLVWMKEEMADRLLTLPADEVYDARMTSTAPEG